MPRSFEACCRAAKQELRSLHDETPLNALDLGEIGDPDENITQANYDRASTGLMMTL